MALATEPEMLLLDTHSGVNLEEIAVHRTVKRIQAGGHYVLSDRAKMRW
jgi:predicted ABC-type ATPase